MSLYVLHVVNEYMDRMDVSMEEGFGIGSRWKQGLKVGRMGYRVMIVL